MLGTISEEVENETGIPHQTASPRRTDLRAAGYTDYYYENGKRKRRDTSRGKGAYIEVATLKGINAIKHNLPIKLNGGDITSKRHRGNAASADAFASSDFSRIVREILACMVKHTPKKA
jgi:hypothetical protein